MSRISDDSKFIQGLYRRSLSASMLAILGSVLGQIVNAAIIGQTLGAGELSVIGVTLPVYYAYATVGALLGVGGTAVCARLMGKDRFGESRRAFTCVYLMMLAFAAVLSILTLLFRAQIAALLGVTPAMEIYPGVMEYMRVLSLGGIGIMSIYPAFNFLRLDGRNTATAAVFFVMAGVNIILSVVLLLGLRTGVAGAAVSTVCGAGFAGLLGAVLLFTNSKNFRFALRKSDDGARLAGIAKDILLLGSPSALENLCILTRTAAINWILTAMLGGVASLAAFKVIDSVNSFAQIFIAGASGCMIPFIGVFASEKDTGSIRQLLTLGFKWGGVMSLVFTGICLVFTRSVAVFFGMGDAEILPTAMTAIRIFALSLPLALASNILVCLYQANRKTAAANVLTLGRSLVWVLLAAFLLTGAAGLGLRGVWHSFWIAEVLALAVAAVHTLFYRAKNKYLSPLFLLDTEAEKNGTYQSFSVRNTVEAITDASVGISAFCESNDLPPKQTMAISLAIEEMLVSIHTHALPANENLTMSVRVLVWEDMVVMRIRNAGKTFNPLDYYEQQKAAQADTDGILDGLDMISDSLGIKMILKLALSVNYQSTFGVNNITIIL